MPQIDLELSKSLKHFVSDTISVNFLKDFDPISNTINCRTGERPMHYLFEENVAVFSLKNTFETLQMSRKISTSLFLCHLCTF